MSFVRMGFRKLLFVNGHGSNPPFLQIACRKVVNHSQAHVATVSWWSLIPDKFREHRETPVGGAAHACEVETSMYLHICPERVRMERAVADIAPRWSNQVWVDLETCGPVTLIDDWSRVNATGVEGDPMSATAEKGRLWSEATIERLIAFMDDYQAHPVKPRRNFNHLPEDPGGPKP